VIGQPHSYPVYINKMNKSVMNMIAAPTYRQ